MLFFCLKCRKINESQNPKYDGYQLGLASVVYTFFNKKSSGSVAKSEIMPNQ